VLQRPKPPELRPCPVRRDPATPHQIPVKNGRAAQPAVLQISACRVPALQQLDWSPAVRQIEWYYSTLPPCRLPASSCLPADPQVQPPFLQNHPQLRPPFPLGTCKQIYALPPLSLPSSAIYLPDCLCLLFFRVSSLAYPNLLGKKGYVVVVVVVLLVPSVGLCI